jgi:hypothetical protein
VRPTHRSEIRTVPEWCVGRTLPIGLNLMALTLKPWQENGKDTTDCVFKINESFIGWTGKIQLSMLII